jgi:hypothetical protein
MPLRLSTRRPAYSPGGGGGINVNLAYKEEPKVARWFNANGDEIGSDTDTDEDKEAVFLAALIEAINNASTDTDGEEGEPQDPGVQDGYDYAADPQGLKRAPGATANPTPGFPAFELSGETYYRHFIKQFNEAGEEEDVFKTPILNGKIFTGWRVSDTPTAPITIPSNKQNPFDHASWYISLPSILEKRAGPYLQLVANWTDDPKVAPAKVAVEKTLDDVKKELAGAEYQDDYVISGPIEGDLADLQTLLNEAAKLLQGTAQDIIIDNIDDGEGGSIKKVGQVIVYDAAALEKVKADIDEELTKLKSTDKLISASVYPEKITIQYPTKEYDYTSVTIAEDGFYEIELWGATGGPVWTRNDKTALGGYGGHVKAKVKLKAGDVLKFFIGGAGEGSATYNPDPTVAPENRFTQITGNYLVGKAGGKPNGGKGGNTVVNTTPPTPGGSGGGGSTDVRLLKDGYKKDGGENAKQGHGLGTYDAVYTNTINDRILVAGGGGGAAQRNKITVSNVETWPGLKGGNPGEKGAQNGGTTYTGDTVTATDGKGTDGCNATDAWETSWEGRGGGGGGYKGGSAATKLEENIVAGGGGGTNFPSGPSDDTFTSANNTNFPSNDTGRSIENLLTAEADYLSNIYGNGSATIKWSGDNITK